jgi:hypothetical protein
MEAAARVGSEESSILANYWFGKPRVARFSRHISIDSAPGSRAPLEYAASDARYPCAPAR